MTREIPDVHPGTQIIPPSPPPMISTPPPLRQPPQRPPPATPISMRVPSSLASVPVSIPYSNTRNQNQNNKHSRNISNTTTHASRSTHGRKISLTASPDQILRSIRDSTRDSYQKIKEFPAGFQYAVTPSAPSIQTFSTNAGRSMHSFSGAPVIPSGPSRTAPTVAKAGCAGRYMGYMGEIRCRVKGILSGFHFSISVGCTLPVEEVERRRERTLRIKNNRNGCCIYEVETSSTGPTLIPLQSLKPLLPNSKYLQKSLIDWNRHFQSPPAHWVINFIPRAYLRRGYYLAEDVCEYLLQNPDGCLYRIEYEPIGHESVLVGSIVPRGLARRERNPSRHWEGRERRGVLGY
ncbi:unnamed protein product [Tuber melanosporum]|uniref:(Perigord truffle) hypothetical protein n=1 Tax=Tuber melanosporum (strain Mel28) TaxID=656061 RepID=D5GI09_TUBMM|nr:uncharacterized protein GSTUM_00008221001 [Tuber melanosporum]CAZ84152.1 unnamed protein product [Tuber melanosporum]